MGKKFKPSANRRTVYHFVRRAHLHHANCTSVCELDVTELMSAIAAEKARGGAVSITAVLAKATALVLERYPRLNRHLFHGLFGRYEYQPDGVHCAVLVKRQLDDGEEVLFPAVVKDAAAKSIAEIDAVIKHHTSCPLEELEAYRALQKLKPLPELARRLIALAIRSSHRVHAKVFAATYTLSSFRTAVPYHAGNALSPTASGFLPGTITDRPWVVNNQIVIRKIMPMSMVIDHYLLDGSDTADAMALLAELLREPARLGLGASTTTQKPDAVA